MLRDAVIVLYPATLDPSWLEKPYGNFSLWRLIPELRKKYTVVFVAMGFDKEMISTKEWDGMVLLRLKNYSAFAKFLVELKEIVGGLVVELQGKFDGLNETQTTI